MERPTFSLILPCYNEYENLKILVPDIVKGFAGLSFELVFVDDGSTDGTREEIRRLQKTLPAVTLVERPKLMGLGSALRDGYNAGKGKYLISFDCDLPIPVEDARKVADKLLTGNVDLVLGSRYLKGSFYEAPTKDIRKKKVVSRCANLFFRVVNLIAVTDFTFNCRGMTREAWQKIQPQSNNNFFLFEMVWRASRHGLRIGEVPVRFYDRKLGKSKLQLGSEMSKYLKQFFKLRWKYLFRKVD